MGKLQEFLMANEENAQATAEVAVSGFPVPFTIKAITEGENKAIRKSCQKVIFDKNTGEWLGCHLIGDNVTEMIAGAVMARRKKMTGEDVIRSVFPHPTMSEAIMEAAADAYKECVHL